MPFFDTNILIDWLRRRPQAYAELSSHQELRISRITWAEVMAGEAPKDRATVAALLSHMDVVELDPAIAALAAGIRYGTHIRLLDAFILATARVNGGILITRDTRAFPPGTPGIHIPYTL